MKDLFLLQILALPVGRSPFDADRNHLHHIVQRAGFKPAQTVGIVHALAVLLAAIGVAYEYYGADYYQYGGAESQA